MTPSTKIYLKIGDQKITIPVNPEEIEVKLSSEDKSQSILGVGEVLIPVKPSLRQVSFKSFFPGDDDVFVTKYKSPKSLAKKIETAWKGRVKCRIIITRSNDYDLNMLCVISDFETTDKGGEPDDLYYSITLKEYREYGAQTMQIVTETAPESAVEPQSVNGIDWTLAPGQTVSSANTQKVATLASPAGEQRPVETSEPIKDMLVTVNGPYYATSDGGEPVYQASNLTGSLKRIENGKPYPYLVGTYGWVSRESISEMVSIWDTI